jgi:arabinofuranan 3-O-arabinosyltransferase
VLTVPRSPTSRILVVPESVNPGWVAHNPDGATLTPVIVNGWQQGWVLPAGAQGAITLSFPTDGPYRAGLAIGLGLLPLLLLLALLPPRRPVPDDDPPQPWAPRVSTAIAVAAAGALIGGVGGLAVFGGAIVIGYLIRDRRVADRATLFAASVGLIAAGALLSRYPWRSVDGYIGFSPWVQLPALIAVGAVAASAVPRNPAPPVDDGTDPAPDGAGADPAPLDEWDTPAISSP